jgi:hypothetical protein
MQRRLSDEPPKKTNDNSGDARFPLSKEKTFKKHS